MDALPQIQDIHANLDYHVGMKTRCIHESDLAPFCVFLFMLISSFASAEELLTNCAHFADAPKWVTLHRVNKVAEPIENILEWSTHRVEVIWYHDQAAFEKAHDLGPAATAVTLKGQNKVLLGPTVNDSNFDRIFGHELVHVIFGQKYVGSIPGWLEEGAANYIAKDGVVNYAALAREPIADVKDLVHPMRGTPQAIHLRYQASQALAEMLAKKCDFRNLLRLSVQRKLEDYLENICKITDINSAYRKWIQDKKG